MYKQLLAYTILYHVPSILKNIPNKNDKKIYNALNILCLRHNINRFNRKLDNL